MSKREPIPAECYVRWTPQGVWHAARTDDHTVCGLPFNAAVTIVGWATAATWAKTPNVCRSCERMKDADTVQRPMGEI